MDGFIEVKDVKTGKYVSISVLSIAAVSSALQAGSAYGYIMLNNNHVIISEEGYETLKDLIKEAIR